MVWARLHPRPRRKSAFSFDFNRFTDFGSGFSLGFLFIVVPYPKNFLFQGRPTALFFRFTFSRSRFYRKRSSDAITRSPAACDFTYT